MPSNSVPRIKYLAILIGVFLFVGASTVFAQTNPPTGFTPQVNTSGTLLTPCDPGVKDCYQLLEPLPTADGDMLDAVSTAASGETGIGGFINFMIEIGIGVAGVLGIVMLTVYGFQYAAEDKNVMTFESLKTKITGVVLGLLLLLGIFIILRTINPDLLIINPDIAEVKLELSESFSSDIDSFIPDPSGVQGPSKTLAAANCPSGVINIPNELPKSSGPKVICKDLSDKLIALKSALTSTGVGFRITATTNGSHQSSCHRSGNAKTGSCVDIALPEKGILGTDSRWGALCQAVSTLQGVDFINEVNGNSTCNAIKRSARTKYRTGNHLHIVYTGQ